MTYNEIVGIFGSPGELMSETSMAGYTTKVYTWTARDGFSNCVITLQNDAVMSKSQFGLP
ncbi:MAG: hypothetical protein GY771_04100 [bacterium]|nr:hypothetical protein [bacterium]